MTKNKNPFWKKIIFSSMVALALFPLARTFAAEGINEQLTFYGVMKYTSGNLVPDGTYDAVFKIYGAPTGGTPLWSGNHTAANGNPVEVKMGNFVVLLGSGTGNAMTPDFEDDTYYVGVTVGTDSEMIPRQRIGAAAYSFNSDAVDGSHVFKVTVSPEGSQFGSAGDIALDTTNNKLYIKSSGTNTNTGWAEAGALSDESVTTAKILDGTITATDMSDGSITTVKISDGNVTEIKIADGAISTGKLADNSVTSTKIIDGTIITQDLADNSITTSKITDLSITNAKLSVDAVTTDKIADGTIATADLADDAVTNAKMADNSVNSVEIVDGAVITAKLADGSVTSAKITDGTIVTADMADGAVTSTKIADDTIMDADVNTAANIALSKLANGLNIITSLAPPSGSNANGGNIANNALTLSFADITNPGLVSTSTQTFTGEKTFNNFITANGTQIAQGAWTLRGDRNLYWQSVIYGGGQFVAISKNDAALTSPDGITWTQQGFTNPELYQSLAYGNGVYVAVGHNFAGDQGKALTSPDGITWTERSAAANNKWQSVTFANGLFVAVSNTGTGNRVMTSPDGITWTARTSAADNNWMSVAYGNGIFTAVAASGTNRVMTSPDGITWTARVIGTDTGVYNALTYNSGVFVAVGDSGAVATSPNGVSWTERTAAATNNWQGVAYGNGLFAAVSNTGTSNRVMISLDNGATWTTQASAADSAWMSVVSGNNTFVAVAETGSSVNNYVMTSAAPTVGTAIAATGGLTLSSGSPSDLTNALYNLGGDLYFNGSAVDDSPWTTTGSNIYYATGNVGIGTSTPDNALSVNGGITLASLTPSITANALYNQSGTLYFNGSVVGNPDAFLNDGNAFGSLATLGTTDSNALRFVTNNTEAIRILSDGRVGVGTDTPGAKLAVVDTNGSTTPFSVGGQSSTQLVSGYSYRAPITVTASSALTDYETKITVNTASLVTAGKMQADGDDIRFTSSDGTTIIPHYVEKGMNTASTVIWVKTTLASGSNSLYMYYGNPSETTNASNGSNVFAFFDDFTGTTIDTGKWIVDNSTGLSVSGGSLKITSSNARIRSQWTYSSVPVIQETQGIINTDVSNEGKYITIGGFYNSGTDHIALMHTQTLSGLVRNEAYHTDATPGVTNIGGGIGLSTEFLSRASVISGTQVGLSTRNYNTDAVIGSATATNTVSSGERVMLAEDVVFTTVSTADFDIRFVRVRQYTATEPSVSVGSEGSGSTTSTSTFLTVNSSGNVGIGTSTPDNALSVNGGITLASLTPSITANALYNQSGALYFNGLAVGGGSSQWTTSGSNIYYTTGNVGVGTTSPTFKLALAGTSSIADRTIGINGTSVIYLADQGTNPITDPKFVGSLAIGDGLRNLSKVGTYDGVSNTAIGMAASRDNTTGAGNISFGVNALMLNTTGNNNTAIGTSALSSITSGRENTALGGSTGDNLTTGFHNIVVGYDIDAPSATATNTLNIGNLIYGNGVDGSQTVLSSGNVGIGIASPSTKLHVAGAITTGGHILPSADDTYDLGSAAMRFRDLYLGPTSLHIGDKVLSNNSGSLVWSGTSIEASSSTTSSTELKLSELSTQGTHYTGFKSPDALATNVLYTLPSADGTGGQSLVTNGSGGLSWASSAVGKTSTVHHGVSSALPITTIHNNAEIHVESTGGFTIDGASFTEDTFGATIISTDAVSSVTLTPSNFAGSFLRDGTTDAGFATLSIEPDTAYKLTVTNNGGSKFLNVIKFAGGSSQWTTSGSNVYYNTGNVAIGTSSPSSAKLLISGVVVAATSGSLENAGLVTTGATSVDTTTVPGETIVKYTATATNTFTPPTGVTSVRVLVVAGGGGGAGSSATYTSGGGAGRMVLNSTLTVAPGTSYTITVGSGGAGGAGGAENNGTKGGNSSIGTLAVAEGGGYGGKYSATAGGNGGSGGAGFPGGSALSVVSIGGDVTNPNGYGNNGETTSSGQGDGGGAGTGAGAGSGRASTITGSSVTYATGGLVGVSGVAAVAGLANTGQGGQGGAWNGGSGGAAGGSGVVIVRFTTVAAVPAGAASDNALLRVIDTGSVASSTLAFFEGTSGSGCIVAGGTGLTCSSDIRLKKNVETMNSALGNVLALKPVTYDWRSKNEVDVEGFDPYATEEGVTGNHIGFIAQDVEQIFPGLVVADPNGKKTLAYDKFAPILVKAIQELNEKVDALDGSSGTKTLAQMQEDLLNIEMEEFGLKLDTLLDFEEDGSLAFDGDITFKGRLAYEDEDMAGYAEIPQGKEETKVEFKKEYNFTPIIQAVPLGNYSANYWVEESETDAKSFKIMIDSPLDKKARFSWLALAVKNPKNSEADDEVSPIITLNGEAVIALATGGSYIEPGATATDDIDGDITALIVKTITDSAGAEVDSVDTTITGEYTITYTVQDAAGNSATPVTRTVVVE